jgi:hypothetical protein
MMRTALAAVLLVCISVPAFANETVLSRDNGKTDTYEKLATDGHYISFSGPGWPHAFAEELQVYGYRFGNVAGTLGTVVLWDLQPAPKPTAPPKPGDPPAPTKQAHILATKQFPLSIAPEKAGWFSIPLDPTELPKSFGVSVFTRSSENAGLWVGLTGESHSVQSYSSAGVIKVMASEPRMKMRHDGRNWLIRLSVRDTLNPQTAFTSAQLSGKNFALLDDGGAEGFATTQKDGPIVKFNNDAGRRLKRVYVFAKLDGTQWFNSDRQAGVWILNESFGIMAHTNLAFRAFTNSPSWGAVDLPDILLPKTYYVLIEPVSRPQAQLLVGYDSSSPNKASLFGSAGALHKWNIEAPEENTNWMIRVEYR